MAAEVRKMTNDMLNDLFELHTRDEDDGFPGTRTLRGGVAW